MTNADLETIRRAISEVCAAYEEPDSPEALSCAFYQLRRVRDYVHPAMRSDRAQRRTVQVARVTGCAACQWCEVKRTAPQAG